MGSYTDWSANVDFGRNKTVPQSCCVNDSTVAMCAGRVLANNNTANIYTEVRYYSHPAAALVVVEVTIVVVVYVVVVVTAVDSRLLSGRLLRASELLPPSSQCRHVALFLSLFLTHFKALLNEKQMTDSTDSRTI